MRKMIGRWNEISLVKRIIMGLIVGIILGIAIPQVTVISILGDLFVGALKAVAPLLVLFLVMGASPSRRRTKGGSYRRLSGSPTKAAARPPRTSTSRRATSPSRPSS